MKQYILITGIAGLIGSNLAKWIQKNHPEYEIVGIDSMIGGLDENIPDFIRFFKKDLAKDDIDKIFERYKPKYVFHFAAFAAEGLSPFMRKTTYLNNCVATAAVVNACIKTKVEKLVYASSMAVYGTGRPPFDEYDDLRPEDPYGISKLACELDIREAFEQHGLNYCILRFHNVYGPGQNIYDPYRNVIGIWMYRAKMHQPLQVYGDGSQKRAFTYIKDILEPIWCAAELPKAAAVYNVGDTPPVRLEDVATTLKRIVESQDKMLGVQIEHKEARREVREAWPSGRRSERDLKFSYRTSLTEGLQEMWEWARKLPYQTQQTYDEYELDEGLYSYWKKN